MNKYKRSGKYVYVLYCVIIFFVFVDLMLITFAQEFQIGLLGVCCLIATLPGLVSTLIIFEEKSFLRSALNFGIAVGIILIILFVPGI